MDIIIKQLEIGSLEYWDAFELRNTILRVPRGLNLHEEELPFEQVSCHSAAYINNKVVGTICWYRDNEKGIVKHLVVADCVRGKGIGRMLLANAEKEMASQGIKFSYLKARITAKVFYEKMGYDATGNILMDDVPHIMMEKPI